MKSIRLISRLDIKSENLIKGVQMEGLRVLGDPAPFAKKYYSEGIDELIFIDSVASLYGRNNLANIIERTASEIFVPLTVGGGIRSVEDAKRVLRCGADKVAINSAAIKSPILISQLADEFGTQAVVISIEAKRERNGDWLAYSECGREKSSLNVLDWAIQATSFGAGEILLTSVDQDGTFKGFDIELIKQVSNNVGVPVIASGGMGKLADIVELMQVTEVEAVAVASLLHYNLTSISEVKNFISSNGFPVRN